MLDNPHVRKALLWARRKGYDVRVVALYTRNAQTRQWTVTLKVGVKNKLLPATILVRSDGTIKKLKPAKIKGGTPWAYQAKAKKKKRTKK